MKVFELMSILKDYPAGADVQCVQQGGKEIFGELSGVSFEGDKADDAYVQLQFSEYEE